MGQKGQAIREVATAAQLCSSGSPRLLATHSAQLHTLLGLYSMSMNCLDAAEAQLTCALRVSRNIFIKRHGTLIILFNTFLSFNQIRIQRIASYGRSQT